MEEETHKPQEPVVEVNPVIQNELKGKSRKYLIGLLILLPIVGIVGFVFLTIKSSSQKIDVEIGGVEDVSIEEAPSPTPEVVIEVGKSEVSINVLNGTGISGEAKHLQGILAGMGFEKIETGNADSEEFESTQVSFSSKVPETLRTEVVDKLKSTYEGVKVVDKSPSGDFDIEVITGLRPGVGKKTPTPKPTPTITPKSTSTSTPTATPTVSSTPTPTPTPTAAP